MKKPVPMNIITGRDIICFANDFDSDPLSKKHLMMRLAKHNRVLWVNSIGTRNPQASVRDLQRSIEKLKKFTRGCERRSTNLYLFSPIAIPFHGNRAAQLLNRQWLAWSLRRVCRQIGFKNPITWTFLPTTADVVGRLNEKLVVYHCVDEFSEFTGTNKEGLLAMERRLMKKADMVVVSSGPLYDTKRQYNANTFLVTHGVDVEHFRQACSANTVVPPDIAALERPVIGFHGLIADWVDLQMIRFLAMARPDWSFVLVGKSDTDTSILDGLSNVHLIGRKEYRDLPAYCKGFDVGLLPFVINELTLAANPLKLREYLAAGLPVVSTDIPEARRLGNLIRIGNSNETILAEIDRLLAEGKRGPSLATSLAVDSESWDSKVGELTELVERVSARDAAERPRIAGLEESWIGRAS
jgi:glycosyltransferase involved in cell wall biosynthesis